MHRLRPSAAVGAAVAAAVLLAAAPALAGDLLQKKTGEFAPSIQGDSPAQGDFDASGWTVVDADLESVRYQMRLPGSNRVVAQEMRATDVLEIWLDPKSFPTGWKEAADALNQGNYKAAAGAFRAVAESKGNVHPVLRQKAYLNYARAMAGAGGVVQGAQAFEQALAAIPKSFYARALLREEARLLMDAGKLAEALEVIGKVLKLPGVTNADKIEARLLQVTVDYRKATTAGDKGAIQKALDEFKSVANDTKGQKDLADVHSLARLGQANAALEVGNGKEARGLFQEIADSASANSVLASAFNGLGMTYYDQGNREGWTEARRAFLRTVVRHSEGAPADEIARALYHIAECFNRLQDHDEWKQRAQNEARECIRRFPSSPWTEKCRRLLMGMPK